MNCVEKNRLLPTLGAYKQASMFPSPYATYDPFDVLLGKVCQKVLRRHLIGVKVCWDDVPLICTEKEEYQDSQDSQDSQDPQGPLNDQDSEYSQDSQGFKNSQDSQDDQDSEDSKDFQEVSGIEDSIIVISP